MTTTSLEKLRRAERWRIGTGEYASTEVDGWNGTFLVPLEGEIFHVMISDGMGWKHLSISNAQYKKLPSWQIMCRIKACFFGDDEYAVQFFPPKDSNVNDCAWCLHLWLPINEPMPTPPIVLV